jgi:type III pantothenate kinase
MMFLAIDIGNTNTVLGIDDGSGAWVHQWRISTVRSGLGSDWAAPMIALAGRDGIELRQISAAMVASVVPTASAGISEFCEEWCNVSPSFVSSACQLNISLGVDNPGELGADRIANMVAALALTGGSAIVVDLGTATKVEAMSADGVFVGGAISIGLGVSIEALAARASRLFAVDLALPKRAAGRNTTEALRAGIVRGHQHLVRGLVDDMRAEVGSDAPLILTGGHVRHVGSDFLPGANVVPDLTLNGIRLIHAMNRPTGS